MLQKLHDELERTESLDEQGREMLVHLSKDIQKMLGGRPGERPTIMKNLQDAIDHFEVDHPAITAALSQMLNTLSNAGI